MPIRRYYQDYSLFILLLILNLQFVSPIHSINLEKVESELRELGYLSAEHLESFDRYFQNRYSGYVSDQTGKHYITQNLNFIRD